MKASVIIRTYNEERYLPALLKGIRDQETENVSVEVILVDSGSTDNTLQIANDFGCVIKSIRKEEFSFGKSLNIGCETASGQVLIFISGHCIPVNKDWLINLITPIITERVVWAYGRQIGNEESRFSEQQIFDKYFPAYSSIPQNGFFCNNANAAVLKNVWEKFRFDEELTGLEDMHLAQKVVNEGMKLGYVSEAPVFHLHDENWRKVKNRFEREAIALQRIMPEVQISFSDFLRYYISSVMLDYSKAIQERIFFKKAKEILMYRLAQYWGSYQGNHSHRKISKKVKEQYFYPR